jgi:hypothetical protein
MSKLFKIKIREEIMEHTEKRICFYCKKEIVTEEERGYFKAVINGNLEDFHKACYKKYSSEGKSGVSIKIR